MYAFNSEINYRLTLDLRLLNSIRVEEKVIDSNGILKAFTTCLFIHSRDILMSYVPLNSFHTLDTTAGNH